MSLASRMPLNCHRASGGKKLRYVRRMCERGYEDDGKVRIPGVARCIVGTK